MTKTCPICNNQFIAKTSGQVCCSTSCRSKKIQNEKKHKNKKCILCGKEYKSKAWNSMYCSNRCKLDSIKVKPSKANCKWCSAPYLKFKGKQYCSAECKRRAKQNLRVIGYKKSLDKRLCAYLRHYLFRAVKGKQYNSKYYLGYTITELKAHLESRFQEGMSWDNYGEWHIDHIRPLISFNFYNKDGSENIEEIKKAMKLDNLQPLWARDNISKGGRYTAPMEA